MSILAAHAHPLPPRPPPAEPQIHRQIQQRLPSTLPPVASQSTPHPAHLPKRPTADLPAPLSSSRSMHTPASAAASSSRTSSNGVCSHLSSVLNGSADLFEKLRLGVRWSVKLASASEHDKKRRKLPPPRCTICSISLSRPMLCLDCGSVLCDPSQGSNHAYEHALQHRHELFWDLHSSCVFCFGCSDYVYHPSIERLVASENAAALEEDALATDSPGTALKRKRVTPSVWKPSASTSGKIESSLPRGLRNLGQSCFMNVILQAFLHNPALRVYFLSDRHNRALCEQSQRDEKPCLSCEMDRLFSECCSSNSMPFGPTNFLHSVWQSSTELSGYAQQDAHEFLISALNLVHSSTPGCANSNCTCIVHSTFAGQLRSEVRCGQCGNVTDSTDPFLDLSLDLRGGMKLVGVPTVIGENTLADCLTRFTSPEQLPPNEYTCGTCGDAAHTASKQLSIYKLPPVLCIQLKRFEHTGGSHKVDTPIRYPLKLNMSRYMSSTLARKGSAAVGPDSAYEYELNSLVAHEGSLTNGHYTSICRGPDDFWCFDDDKVRRATLAEVLAAKAYLLIYTRKSK